MFKKVNGVKYLGKEGVSFMPHDEPAIDLLH